MSPFHKPRLASCARCGVEFTALWARQKHCADCQVAARSTLAQQGIRRTAAAKTAAYAAVAVESSKSCRSLAEAFERPQYQWTTSFRVPYDIASSKNRRWAGMAGGRGVYIPAGVRSYSDLIALKAKEALRGIHVYENRIWISVLVQKPDHKSDAVNVVDTFCDAIKAVIGVDDRWFSLDIVDWEIKKHQPQIMVRIGQADLFDARPCSHCGGVFPLDSFHKHKGNRLGVARECKDCKSAVSLKRKELRAAS